MKALKIVGIVLLVYVGIVVVFESLLGYFQPGGDYTMVITTTSADGDIKLLTSWLRFFRNLHKMIFPLTPFGQI